MLALVLSIQAVAGPPVPRDLRPLTIVKPCLPDDSGDIVVCGKASSGQRLERMPASEEADPANPLSFRLPGGGKGDVHAVQSTLPGAIGSGAVVSVILPFGKHRKD